MLKIKDNVDLKKLEKYGFKPVYNCETGEIESFNFKHQYGNNTPLITLVRKTFKPTIASLIFRKGAYDKRQFYVVAYFDDVAYDYFYTNNSLLEVFYEMFKDGIIEKVNV